jgi:hypothetical protein
MAIAEQSLLQTRRPVLLAPARLQSDLTDSVMIAWDESPECWHAVSAAIPFMEVGKSVRVISVDRDADRRRRRKCSPICAAMASLGPRRWSHRSYARPAGHGRLFP